MTTVVEVGDNLVGDVVIAEARSVSKPIVLSKTSRHRAIRVKLKGNVECTVLKKLKILE